MQRLDFQKQHAQEKISQLKTEAESLDLKSHSLVEGIAAAKERIHEFIDQNRQMETVLESLRNSSLTLEDSVSNHEAAMKELQRRWGDIGPRIHEIERDHAANEMHLEYLAKEVYDKYALPMEELPLPLEDE